LNLNSLALREMFRTMFLEKIELGMTKTSRSKLEIVRGKVHESVREKRMRADTHNLSGVDTDDTSWLVPFLPCVSLYIGASVLPPCTFVPLTS
jgi:hypothetical protein